MTDIVLSFLESHLKELRHHLFPGDGNEHIAYVLFGKAIINSPTKNMYISHAIEYVEKDAIITSSPWEISWQTNDLVKKLKKAQAKNLILGIVHNHPTGYDQFSLIDNENESQLIQTIQNRNGIASHLISVLFTPDDWQARIWSSPEKFEDITDLRSIGSRFVFRNTSNNSTDIPNFLDRQVLAFGNAFNQQLTQLKVTVVGCGGTGSAVAMLLARLGIGKICLIDNDTVEISNLNRLHGATQKDASMHHSKVDAVGNSIDQMGLGTKIIKYKGWLADVPCRDILKDSHIVFGCTDDNAGRILLNRFAYAYQIPVIDMGLAIELTQTEPAEIQAMDGRVTVLLPGEACLLCRGVINARRASEESLKRQNPKEYERRKSEAYVLGEQNPSPAVITFTTELACMAVNEMIHRIQGYRGKDESTANRVRLFHRMTDLRPNCKPDPECRVCGQSVNWCRGDIEPFLGIVG